MPDGSFRARPASRRSVCLYDSAVTPAALRKLALSLEGAHEEPHFDRTSFRFDNRIFATMTRDGEQAMVGVPLEAVSMMLASQPDVFFSYGKWTTNHGAIGVRLGKIAPGLMKDLLTESYRRVVEKASKKRRPAKKKTGATKTGATKTAAKTGAKKVSGGRSRASTRT